MNEFSSVVSPSWLVGHLDDPRVAIADCRFSLTDADLGRQLYQESHIPGAYYLDLNRDLSSPVARHGGRHPLPDLTNLAAKVAAMGVDSRNLEAPTLVVAYDDSQFAYAARFWWLLRYMGYDHVAVLDGGFSGWQALGYPVTNVVPESKTGYVVPQLRQNMAVDIATVKARKDLPEVVLVDSREGDRYRGEREPIDPIAGHIPGAVNYPWQDVTDEKGFVRPPEQQQQRWAALKPAEEILVYCGSGVTACVNLLSLDMAGIDQAKLYTGSWSDWCSYLTEDAAETEVSN